MNLMEEKEVTMEEFFQIAGEGGEYEVETPQGWQNISELYLKKQKRCYLIRTESGKILGGSCDHLVMTDKGLKKLEKVRITKHKVLTRDGYETLLNKEYIGLRDTYDWTVDSEEHLYYSNDIVSHNTGKTELAKQLAKKLGVEFARFDMSEFAEEYSISKLIGCFAKGTKVLMANGFRKNIEDVEIGDFVITHKGNVKKVKEKFCYDNDNEMLKIRIANSNVPVIVTKTHEFYAIKHEKCIQGESNSYKVCKPTCCTKYCGDRKYKSYKPEWIEAKDLKISDFVLYPKVDFKSDNKITFDLANYIDKVSQYKYDEKHIWYDKNKKANRFIELNKEFVRFAGYYIVEGGSHKNNKSMCFTFHKNERKYIDEVKELIYKIFAINKISEKPKKKGKNAVDVVFCSRIVSIFLKDLFGENVWKKKIPDCFLGLDELLMNNLIETMIYGNGSESVDRRMQYDTVSENLASQFELILRSLGYITYSQVVETDGKNGKSFRVMASGEQMAKLSENINIGKDWDKSKSNIQRKCYMDAEYVYQQINSIEEIDYVDKVHDLHIEDDMSYVVGNMAVHNSAPGYVGFEQGGLLTEEITKKPHCVLLLDEIEKAHQKIFNLLLQVMDYGCLTDNNGKKVNFKNVILIMTSNLGGREMLKKSTIGFGGTVDVIDESAKAVEKFFTPEFRNRLSGTVQFNVLTIDLVKNIVVKFIKQLNSDFDEKKVIVKLNDDAIIWFCNNGFDEKMGARPLEGLINTEITEKLVDEILFGKLVKGGIVTVSIDGNTPKFDFNI